MKKQVLLALALLSPCLAVADEASFQNIVAERESCNREASSQLGYSLCEENASEALDKELILAYQDSLKNMSAKTAQAFRMAQRAWLAYRDAQVAYVSQTFDGGHGQALATISVQNDVTLARTQEIYAH